MSCSSRSLARLADRPAALQSRGMVASGAWRATGATSSDRQQQDFLALEPLPGEALLAAVVMGSASGWDLGDAPVSAAVLRALVGSLARQREARLGGIERALQAAASALRAMPAQDDEDMWSPGATLLVAHLGADHVELAWLGGERAWLLRQGALVEATTPHSLAEEIRLRGQEIPAGTVIPDVVVRHLTPQGSHGGEAGRARWPIAPGDRLVLAAGRAARGLAPAELRAAAQGTAEAAAQRLLEAAEPGPGVVVVADRTEG